MNWLLISSFLFVLIAPSQHEVLALSCHPTDQELQAFLLSYGDYTSNAMALSAEDASRKFVRDRASSRSSGCGFECQRVKRSVENALTQTEHVRAASFEEALSRSVTIDLPEPLQARSESFNRETVPLCKEQSGINVRSKQIFPRIAFGTDCIRGSNTLDGCIFFKRGECHNSQSLGDDYADGKCVSKETRSSNLFNQNQYAFGCDQWILVNSVQSGGCVCELKVNATIVSLFAPTSNRFNDKMRNLPGSPSSPTKAEPKVDFVCYPTEN